MVWLGLATCWRRTSERILSVGSLHALVSCFTWFHKVLGWSSCLALSNQQACVRPCCFTGRPRPLGTGFFNGSMVLSYDLLPPPLSYLTHGSLATGSPRLIAFISSSVTGKAPRWLPVLSYPRIAPILTPPTFANAASDHLFNLFVCFFGLNGLTCSVLLLFTTSNFGS